MRIRIDARALRALMATAEKENNERIVSRPELQAIYVDTLARVLVATDGHSILRIAYDTGNELEEPPSPRSYILKGWKMPGKYARTAIIDLFADTIEVVFRTGRRDYISNLVRCEYPFPPYERVIPSPSTMVGRPESIHVNPELLARVSRELQGGVAIRFSESNPDTSKIQVTFPSYSRHDATLIVMPFRLE